MPQPRKLHDEFFKRAKAEGYLARSAYKLLEIQERHRLLRRGDRVLDLGCAPGSWLQVAEKIVTPAGRVVGIDLSSITHPFPSHVRTLQLDAFAADPALLLAAAEDRFEPRGGGESNASGGSSASGEPRRFDVVLSDMAPNTSGHGDDHLSARLCRRVLELLPSVLRVGGHLAMKVLEGSDFPELLRETKAMFREVKGFKPKSSRDVSREIFIVAEGFKGVAPAAATTNPKLAKAPPPPRAGW